MRRITLQVKETTHMMLKLLAVFERKNLNEITEEALEEFISSRADTLKSLLDSSRERLVVGVAGAILSIFTNNQSTTVPKQQDHLITQRYPSTIFVKNTNASTTPMDNIRLIGDPIISGNRGLSRLNLYLKT